MHYIIFTFIFHSTTTACAVGSFSLAENVTRSMFFSSSSLSWRRTDADASCSLFSPVFRPPFHCPTVQRKESEMKQRLAWNNGEPHRQPYKPISSLWHTLLAIGTPLFHTKRCSISSPFLCTLHWIGWRRLNRGQSIVITNRDVRFSTQLVGSTVI